MNERRGNRAIQSEPGAGAVFRLPDGEYQVKTGGEATGGTYAAWETTSLPGGGPPWHVHPDTDEAFYVLEGEYEIVFEGAAPVRAGPGTFVHAPRGRAHTFRCLGPGPGRFLGLAFPAGFERFLAEAHQPAGTAPDVARLETAARRHGIELVGPPLDAAPHHTAG
jgi:quercetin dioxygenase-like cupin family protein